MADPLVHVGASINCPHGASVQVISSNTRVLVSGQPVATMGDSYVVSGCPFQVPIGTGTKPQPCVTARFLVPAKRVLVSGTPAIITTSSGLCQSAEQIPQGPPTVVSTQIKASAT